MVRLFKPNKINLLRDLRKEQALNWLLPEEYLFFVPWYDRLERTIASNTELLKEYGVTLDEFMASLSTPRPGTNFNPDNRLGKPRHKWSKKQIEAARRLR